MAGYPVANIKPGVQTIVTEADGPSNSNDYYKSGVVVSLDGVSPVPPNTPIPPGTRLQVYAPATWNPQQAASGAYATQNVGGWNTTGSTAGGGVGSVVTGTQIPLDAATRDNLDANTAQAYAAIDQAKKDFALNVAQYGEAVATRIFNQQVQQATLGLSAFNANLGRAGVQMQANQQGYDQRTGAADRKLQIMGMMADRSGPQDWVKYDKLVNGLSAPSGQTTHLDPFSILDGLIQPGQVDIPASYTTPQIPIAGPTPIQQQPAAPTGSAPAPGSAPQSIPMAQPQQQPGAAAPVGADPYKATAQPAVAMSAAEQAARAISAQKKQTTASNPASFGSPMGRFANGGMVRGGEMAIVGDHEQGRTGVEEMLVNLNPDPNDQVMIIPMGNRPLPPRVPRAATGGVYGATSGYDFTKYTPDQLGDASFLKSLRGQKVGGSFGGFGAQLSNPDYGVTDAPWNISYQQLMQMKPSQVDMAKGFYQDALWTDWRDVVENARRAAPVGSSFGATQYAA